MYKIQANAKGSRFIDVTEENLETIEKYSLFKDLIPSNGIVDETTLEQLRHYVKSYIMNNDDCKDMIDLAFNVIYHSDMKVLGLKELVMLYVKWNDEKTENEESESAQSND